MHGTQEDLGRSNLGTDACTSLGLLEQPEHDSMSSSSSLPVLTPLTYHARVSARAYLGAPIPAAEERRIAAMCKLQVLETAPELRYDRITALVAQVRRFLTAILLTCCFVLLEVNVIASMRPDKGTILHR